VPVVARAPSQSDIVTEILAPGPMIVAARFVVLAVGLLIVVASVYAIASIAIRMNRREWLQRAGGFEPELGQPAEHLKEILDFSWVLDAG
jgi:hypothetical protein